MSIHKPIPSRSILLKLKKKKYFQKDNLSPTEDTGSVGGSGRSPEEGNNN